MALGEPRFYVDESLMGIARAYARLRRDIVHPGHPAVPQLALGAKDDEWIPAVAQLDLIAILRDKKTRSRPAERAAIIEHGLRCVLIAVKRDLTAWDYNRLLVKHWEKVENSASELGPGPWRLLLHESSVKAEHPS